MGGPGASLFALAALAVARLTPPAGAQDAPDGKPFQVFIPMGQSDRVGLRRAGRFRKCTAGRGVFNRLAHGLFAMDAKSLATPLQNRI